MMDKLLEAEGKIIVAAVLAALARALLADGKRWWERAVVWLVGIGLAFVAWAIASGFDVSEGWLVFCAAVAALLGESIAAGLIKIARGFADDPVKTAQALWSAWRNRNGGSGA